MERYHATSVQSFAACRRSFRIGTGGLASCLLYWREPSLEMAPTFYGGPLRITGGGPLGITEGQKRGRKMHSSLQRAAPTAGEKRGGSGGGS
jgi:hypothetical protein